MGRHLDIKDTAYVLFFDVETGEEIGRSNSVFIEAEINTTPLSRGEIFGRFAEPIEVAISNPIIDGVALAQVMMLDSVPKIKRLIYLHNRTKSKRIKKKLNSRVLDEVINRTIEEVN